MLPRPPSVDSLASDLEETGLPRALLIEVARDAIAVWRSDPGEGDPRALARTHAADLARRRPERVVNATGVLLHTNLGRAPVAAAAAAAAAEVATGYDALEFDLESGRRGKRGDYVRHLLTAVTGADDALVVNNNAGALFLTLAALAGGREAIVSRGELIEIGGSFRLPDLMAASGARLVEVGTTNRTRLGDYRKACGAGTALLLKVHPSNYRIEGFTEEVGYGPLGEIAAETGIPFAADVGSGLLDARVPWLRGTPPSWLAAEPAVRQTLEAGADLVMFSGDKLLGGPQAGIVVGRSDLVAALRSHPVARAVRIDGHRLAALAVTLEFYAAGRGGEIPFWKMAAISDAELAGRCRAVADTAGAGAAVERGRSLPGAGSVPGEGIPGPIVSIPAGREAWLRLLASDPAIVTRLEEGRLVIDLRAVDPADDAYVADMLASACRS
jgi:L-seryl-tRNA(Ser) seleniumtransferase